jgi:hypothetical protein
MIPRRLVSLAVTAVMLPFSTVGAALGTQQLVRSHPRSRELRDLLHAGFDLRSVRVGHRGMPTVAELVRDGERRSVQDPDRAFTIYALAQMQRRRLAPTQA